MLLSIRSLTKTFPGTRALDGVDFDLAAGEVITGDHVRAIRPSGGLPPKERSSVIGRRAALALRRGTPLRPEHLA